MNQRICALIIGSICLIAAGMIYVEVVASLHERDPSTELQALWAIAFFVLCATWVQRDSIGRDFDRTFSFGFYLYLFLPVLLPYYLVRTRGLEGIVTSIGFAALYFLPFLCGLLAYVYFT